MIISLCIVVMNRTNDLRVTLPETIKAAKKSPPVEIVVLNYDSKDDLDEYIKTVDYPITYAKSPNHKFFSISHSRNCAVKASHGDYIVVQDADILLKEHTVQEWRKYIEDYKPVWMCEEGRFIDHIHYGGRLPVVKREEFIKTGGYDERFNLCGPEDKDFCMRMYRRGGKYLAYSRHLIDEIHTRQERKIQNLDKEKYEKMIPKNEPHKVQMTKYLMQLAMREIYLENNEKGMLVANKGKQWGQL